MKHNRLVRTLCINFANKACFRCISVRKAVGKTSQTRRLRPVQRQKRFMTLALAIGLSVPCAADPGGSGVLVRLVSGANINTVAARYGAAVLGSIEDKNLYRLQSVSESDAALLQQLTADPQVASVEEDSDIASTEVVGDPFHFSFDISASPGTFTNGPFLTQINLGQTQARTLGFNVIVAVLDTGVTAAHPFLRNNVMAGLNTFQAAAAPADVPDGVTNTDVGHGTMIAGLIARLAPNAAIMPIRVMNADGKGSTFAVAQGVHYAVTHGARVITMSFTATTASSALSDALDEAEAAGVVVVAAAGNANANLPQLAALNAGAIIVASVESDNTKSPYSNFGSFVSVSAPGSGIRSAFWSNNYATWSGTSFAAPLVAAEAALMLSANPALPADEVASIIRRTAHSLDNANPNYKGLLGSGMIDIDAAARKAGGNGATPAKAAVSGEISLEGLFAAASAQSVTLTFRPADGGSSFDRIVPAGANTAFSLGDLPPRAYTVHFRADRHLAVNVPLNLTYRSVAGLSVTLPAGDANSDNSVDATDFGVLIGAYGSGASVAGSGYDPAADFNGDGTVDATDFGLLVGNYGQQGDN